jgi:helicase required for RNAi-mediated heterochromatin assembly 1
MPLVRDSDGFVRWFNKEKDANCQVVVEPQQPVLSGVALPGVFPTVVVPDPEKSSTATANSQSSGLVNGHIENFAKLHIRRPATAKKIENHEDDEDDQVLAKYNKGDPELDRKMAQLRDYFTWGQATQDQQSWRTRPEMPTAREAMDECETWQVRNHDGDVEMAPNQPKGKFSSNLEYLETHYEFLRDEGVGPLKTVITWVRERHGANEPPGKGHGIYDPVKISGLTGSNIGLGIEVTFSTERTGVKINWEQSSRLMAGSLVALSNDNFQTSCIVAVVAAHDLEKLAKDPPRIDLFFVDPDDIEIDPTMSFVMVEHRNGFYEAQRHTMLALQRMAEEPFSFSKALVKCKRSFNENPPQYIMDNPFFDFSAFYGPEFKKVNIREPLPSDFYRDDKTMDKSQWEALQLMLTKPLAIVQGPPGTGKTFVSLIALKLLLSRMRDDDPPIIVATQTNHALDQLLRHIALDVQNCFARLGGRSKDEGIVRQRTMHELRQQTDQNRSGKDPKGTRNRGRTRIGNLIELFDHRLEPLTVDEPEVDSFVKRDIISKEQADSIICGDQAWVGASNSDTTTSPIIRWLGRAAKKIEDTIPLQKLQDNQEIEAVLEQEQIDERAAETTQDGFQDKLHGKFIELKQNWMGTGETMGDSEAKNLLSTHRDLYRVPAGQRGPLFNYMMKELKKHARDFIARRSHSYAKYVKSYKLGGFERDLVILIQQKLIGMTTTGLSKYRALVQALNPKVILIEEAAEILEAPVAAGCLPSVEQMILVGDHQQLKPQCQQKQYQGDPFYFDLSLFERMINNKFDYRMLVRQRRMIPEVRRLLRPIYNNTIEDHECVKDREDVPGMGGINTFFWKHSFVERKDIYNSIENLEEARMIVGFVFYLLHNGVKRHQITVLTFYNAQRRLLTRLLTEESRKQADYFQYESEDTSSGFNVVTVDSYQGEENQIILLSLVRSNEKGVIGFAGVDNRICVALSRAKRGLYIFGNIDMLSQKSATWRTVQEIMTDRLFIRSGETFPAQCEKHHHGFVIEQPEDWYVLNGGCSLNCGETLPCGHFCPLKCHS